MAPIISSCKSIFKISRILFFSLYSLFVDDVFGDINNCPLSGMDKSFDYVSVTPPYTAVDYAILMAQLENSPVIGEDSFIVSFTDLEIENIYSIC